MRYEIVPILNKDFIEMRNTLNEYAEKGYELIAITQCKSTMQGQVNELVDAWVFKKTTE